MRQRNVWHRLDFLHVEDSQIRLPLMEPIQRIMIRAEALWQNLAANRSPEHAAQRCPVHSAAVYAKPDQASRELVHHHENPMASQDGGFASEQIATP